MRSDFIGQRMDCLYELTDYSYSWNDTGSDSRTIKVRLGKKGFQLPLTRKTNKSDVYNDSKN